MHRSLFPINLKYGISTRKLVEVFSVNHTNTIFKIASLLLMGKSIVLQTIAIRQKISTLIVSHYQLLNILVPYSLLAYLIISKLLVGLSSSDTMLSKQYNSKVVSLCIVMHLGLVLIYLLEVLIAIVVGLSYLIFLIVLNINYV